jgi:uncharacterized membrane protein YfcA
MLAKAGPLRVDPGQDRQSRCEPRVRLEDPHPHGVDAAAVAKTAGMGFVVGTLSGFFGIGGGFLIVPGPVLAAGMAMIDAIGSSRVAVGAFGLATAFDRVFGGVLVMVALYMLAQNLSAVG